MQNTSALRRLIILAAFLALIVAGFTTSVISYRARGQLLRGWRDAASTADLPVRVPLAGVNVELTRYDSAALTDTLDRITAAGFVWLRQPFRWSEIEPTRGSLDFSAYDAIVRAVAAHPTLRLVAVLNETPEWARHAGAESSRFAPPASPADFAAFAGSVAARYKDSIHAYQVWDEPNLTAAWGDLDPQPADYAALLRAAYPLIHAADLNATVIAAALAPTTETGPRNIDEVDYLHALYAAGAKLYFDAAAGKPYGFNSSPLDRTVNAATLNFSRLILMREEMERQGDGGKALWGSAFGWNSLPAAWKGAPSIWGGVDAASQESYTRNAYARAENEWPWIGGLILDSWNSAAPADDPRQGFVVADRIADWSKNGALVPATKGLSIGLHAMIDPSVMYSGAWRFGALGADIQQNTAVSGSTFNVTFEGKSIALLVRRADYVAYLYATLDGGHANALPLNLEGEAALLLTSPDRAPHTDLIIVARNLPPGPHTLAVRAYLGYDHWALAGIAVGNAPDTRGNESLFFAGIGLALLGVIGAGYIGHGLPWARLRESGRNWQPALIGYVRRMRAIGVAVCVSIAAMLGLFLTFGGALPNFFRREPPTLTLTILTAGLVYFSPALIVSIAALIVLFVIIYNRPPLGLALIVFWTPFFLFPVQLYLTAAPMVEISLVLTTVAIVLRGILSLQTQLKLRTDSPSLRSGEGAGGWGKRFHPLDYAMMAFVLVSILTLTWSEQRAPALRELRTMIFEPVLFYILLRLTRLERMDWLRLIDTLLIAVVAVCLIGLGQYVHILGDGGIVTAEGGSQRLASVYGSPNNVALFLGRCIPFALAMALWKNSLPRRIAAAAIVALMLVTALLTQSVGGLLIGIPAACAVVLILWNWRIGAALTVGLGALGGAAIVILPRFVPRLQGLFDGTRESSFIRTRVWQSALNLLRERPLTGAGLDQFLYLYRSRYILPDAYQEPDLSHPHNLLLDYWISLGILGLAILIVLQGFFWTASFGAYRRLRERDILLAALCVGAMGSMADFIAHGLIDNSYFVIDLAYVFWLTLALTVWLAGESRIHLTPQPPLRNHSEGVSSHTAPPA